MKPKGRRFVRMPYTGTKYSSRLAVLHLKPHTITVLMLFRLTDLRVTHALHYIQYSTMYIKFEPDPSKPTPTHHLLEILSTKFMAQIPPKHVGVSSTGIKRCYLR